MADDLNIITGSRTEKYQSLIPQIRALIEEENDIIANLSNVCAALKSQFNFLWIGFYLVKNNELVLGPFQGPVACTRIAFGRGVCGTAWMQNKTIIVDDVEAFPGHIACNSASRSEIVIPLIQQGRVAGVLDVDSANLADFNSTDLKYLEEIVTLIMDKNIFT